MLFCGTSSRKASGSPCVQGRPVPAGGQRRVFLYRTFRLPAGFRYPKKRFRRYPVDYWPGKTLGEIQLLIGGTRSAAVSAVEETRLLKFTRKAFDGLAQNSPEIMQKFAEIIRRRLRRSQLVEILPHLYGPLNPAMLTSIEEEVEWVHLPFGQALFRQGDQECDLYLLVSGRLQVCVGDKAGGERKVAEIKRGE